MHKTALLFLSIYTTFLFGAKGTDIKITVKELANSKLILANYYGDKQYVKDTFTFDKSGVCSIKQDTLLPSGIYLCVFPKVGNKYFEMVVSEPKFSLTTDTLDLAGHMKVEGSTENKVFYDDMIFISTKRKAIDLLSTRLKESKDEK